MSCNLPKTPRSWQAATTSTRPGLDSLTSWRPADRLATYIAWVVEQIHFLKNIRIPRRPKILLAEPSTHKKRRLGHGHFQLPPTIPRGSPSGSPSPDLLSNGRVRIGMGESAFDHRLDGRSGGSRDIEPKKEFREAVAPIFPMLRKGIEHHGLG